MKYKGKDLTLLVWDGKQGKHHRYILNPALGEGNTEFYVLAGQRIGFLETKDLKKDRKVNKIINPKHIETAADLYEDIIETEVGEVIDFEFKGGSMRFKRLG